MDTIGRRLEAARLDQGLSQKQASEKLGCSLATYRMWEKGGWEPAPQWYPSVAAFLGIPREELLGLAGLLTDNQVQLLKASGDRTPPGGSGRKAKSTKGTVRRPNVKGKNLSFGLVPPTTSQAA